MTASIPYGYCHCGCGQKTKISDKTWKKWGYVAGEPHDFVRHHKRRFRGWLGRHVVKDCGYETPCWVWTGPLTKKDGRPIAGANRSAYRLMWQYHRGAIPEGLELDHLCCNKVCVNPDHLEPVTRNENARRHAVTVHGMPEGLGGKIHAARQAAGLNQRELGEAIGVDQVTVGAWERGRWMPRRDHREALKDVLGI